MIELSDRLVDLLLLVGAVAGLFMAAGIVSDYIIPFFQDEEEI